MQKKPCSCSIIPLFQQRASHRYARMAALAAGVSGSLVFRTLCSSYGRSVKPSRTLLVRSIATSHPDIRCRRRRHEKDLFPLPIKRAPATPLSTAAEAIISEPNTSRPNRYPKYNRLLPCPLENQLPRVEHMVVLAIEGAIVRDYISDSLHLPLQYVDDLIHFGAVHYALVCPKPPSSATAEEIQLYEEVTDPSVLQMRSSIKGKTVREAQKTFRVTDVNQFVEAGTYLRVHVHPKRFPRCYEIDWKSRIIAVTDSYVVLDKPAATSVGGTTDNIEECCATFASRALGFETPLKTTHQIDNCTEGCVVFSRTKEFCSVFHGKIREKQVKKLYRALAVAPVPLGIMSHYMRPVNLAPRLVSEDIIGRWHLCQLDVLECNEIAWPTADVEKTYKIDDCGWPSKRVAYECKINLLTGKTHQVRAQFAAVGAPIVGDSMYMPAVLAEMADPSLNPFCKCRREYSSEEEKVEAIERWINQYGKEPNTAIGLQAFHISWDDGACSYEAGTPWWR